ncbi:UNKNOWN [Stylonychia lemnae]|uniref:Uncharacterized protein n=1 Tax=Stylonychia lemnae TaxID=5949 RepID=A0A078AW91_STYLE|nr:UNKNOWN [Stylonychia lemnae]|eukprot:CDW85502.1 UNKNOWN [Stylonychia lemnae]
MFNYVNSGQRTANDFRRSFNHPLNPGISIIQFHEIIGMNEPGSVPAFNGSKGNPVITKKDILRERSQTASGKQNQIGLKAGLNPYQYVPRSKQQSKRSNTQAKYGAGQKAQNQSQIPQGQTLNEPQIPRFNENLDTVSVKKSQGPKSIISTQSKQVNKQQPLIGGSRPGTSASRGNGQQFNKQKILDAVEKLSEKDLEKVSKILEDNTGAEDQSNFQDELNDRVDDLQENQNDGGANDKDETLSRASRSSRYSAIPKSEISKLSNKTYIQHLQTELEEEKQARLKLERELDELKKLSSEISSHLGLNKK